MLSGNISGNHGIGSDYRIITDPDRPQQLGTGKDGDAVTYLRIAACLPVTPAGTTQRNLMVKNAVRPNPRTVSQHNAGGMGQLQARADYSTALNEAAKISAQPALGPAFRPPPTSQMTMLHQADQRQRSTSFRSPEQEPQQSDWADPPIGRTIKVNR
jgi:hypothetical protein